MRLRGGLACGVTRVHNFFFASFAVWTSKSEHLPPPPDFWLPLDYRRLNDCYEISMMYDICYPSDWCWFEENMMSLYGYKWVLFEKTPIIAHTWSGVTETLEAFLIKCNHQNHQAAQSMQALWQAHTVWCTEGHGNQQNFESTLW